MNSVDTTIWPAAMQLPPTAIDPKDRILRIDILRGLALFGVLMVNLVTEFRVSIFQQFVPSSWTVSGTDRFLEAFVSYALDMKAFALFSLLFGVGLAIQFDRLVSRARPFYWLGRRLLILLGFGLLHLLFIWNGDILTEYAIAGLLVLPLLREDKSVLAFCSLGFFALYLALPALHFPIYWPDTSTFEQHIDAANRVYASGGLVQILAFSFWELKFIVPLHEFVFPRTLSLFLLGAWIWKSGLLQNLRQHRREVLVFGLISAAAGVALTVAESMTLNGLLGSVVSNLAPTVQALGYAALGVTAVDLPYLGRFLKIFAPLGRMAFTNYILQSVFFCWIFFGYGLGQFGHLSVTAAFVLGIVVYTVQILGSALWLRWFRFGPLEWLWRSLMYGQPQPMWRVHPRSGELGQ